MKGIAVLLITSFALSTVLAGATWAKGNQPVASKITLPVLGTLFISNPDKPQVTPYEPDLPVPVTDGIQPPASGIRVNLPEPVLPDNWPKTPYRYDSPERVTD